MPGLLRTCFPPTPIPKSVNKFLGLSNFNNPPPPPFAFIILPAAAFTNLKKLPTFLPIKFITAENGFLIKFPNANLRVSPARRPTDPIIFVTPTVSPIPMVPKIAKSVKNFVLNSFNASILPSDPNLIKVKTLSVNHPPARISKKLVNLLKMPCAKVETLLTGDNNAT